MSEACPEAWTLVALSEGSLDADGMRSVDAHLDECADCRAVVSSLSSGVRAKRDGGGRERVGRFELEEELGRGAMGIVYAATDPELDRRVAVKLIAVPDASREVATSRLRREARAMARLSHPNVVHVYEVGVYEDGADAHLFVAMEWVEGEDGRHWLGEARTTEQTLAVLLAAGRGLAAAHDANLVHRDFKPENVLITPDGDAKVGDFGLATGTAETDVPLDTRTEISSMAVTRTGALLGTPAYMAPEQLRGERADARSDQFAFATTLFEALEGRRPFKGSSPAALEVAIDRQRLAFERTPRALRGPIARALQADASARFDDMHAMLAALQPRGRGFAVTAVACALGAGALLVFSLLQTPEAPHPCAESRRVPPPVASAFDDARAALSPTLDPSGALSTTLVGWLDGWQDERARACEATHVEHRQTLTALDRRRACLEGQGRLASRLAAELASDPSRAVSLIEALPPVDVCGLASSSEPDVSQSAARARMALEDAMLKRAAGDSDPQAFARAVALAEAGGHDAELARAMLERDRDELATWQAFEHVDAALIAAQRADDEPLVVRAWLRRAALEGQRGQPARALQSARHAEAIIDRIGEPGPLVAQLHNVLGAVHYALGDLDAARAALERALELRPDAGRAGVLTNLGNVARASGDIERALMHHREALRLERARLGVTPRLARHHHNLGGVYRAAGRLEEAREEYVQAAELAEQGSAQHALTLNSLGLVLAAEGDRDAARAMHTRSAELFATLGHGDIVLPQYNLAVLDADDPAAADRAFTEVLAGLARIGEHDTPRVAKAALGRADALLALGLLDEAREEYERALPIGETPRAQNLGLSDEILERARRGIRNTASRTRPGLRRTPRQGSVARRPGRPDDDENEPSPEATEDPSTTADADTTDGRPITARPSGSAGYGAGVSFD